MGAWPRARSHPRAGILRPNSVQGFAVLPKHWIVALPGVVHPLPALEQGLRIAPRDEPSEDQGDPDPLNDAPPSPDCPLFQL
jgi:hypothetical protein